MYKIDNYVHMEAEYWFIAKAGGLVQSLWGVRKIPGFEFRPSEIEIYIQLQS